MKKYLPFLAAGLAGGVIAGGVVAIADGGSDTKTVVEQAPLGSVKNASSTSGLTAREIYKRYSPGVAFVRAEVEQDGSATPFGDPQTPQEGTATGTGFVVDKQGDILTNAHVVDGAKSVTVELGDNKRLKAEIVGKDTSSDLALLKVDIDDDDLTVLPLGSSKDVTVGDSTVAIGNPFGLDRTLTTGVVSALQRRIEAPDGFAINDVIQTDAAINPGNSGGPLIDASGRVIGVNSQIETGGSSSGNVGIGFAVPIDTAKRIIPQLKKSGAVERAYLGVTSLTIDGDVASLKLPSDHGALVQKVEKGSPADKAGLKAGGTTGELNDQEVILGGDIIIDVDGTKITEEDDLQEVVSGHKAGDKVTITILRDGKKKTVTATLVKRPKAVG
jgi:S1-C subfamily serine protease